MQGIDVIWESVGGGHVPDVHERRSARAGASSSSA